MKIKLTFLQGLRKAFFEPNDFKISKENWKKENYYKHFHYTGLGVAVAVPIFLYLFNFFGAGIPTYFFATLIMCLCGWAVNFLREQKINRISQEVDAIPNFSWQDVRSGFYGALAYGYASLIVSVLVYNYLAKN